ncbi:MAG TPA: hypothetical protein VN625_05765 [Desulfuromonadaceae bacterium]|nr:hypothetical protein [Desulfuromonadaceae bacterium]
MKKFSAYLLSIAVLALTGCPSSPQSLSAGAQKAAIESVFTQQAKLEKQYVGSLNGERLAGLMAIEVKDCPSDFRSAWFDYLIAAQNLHLKAERIAGVGLAMDKPVIDVPSLIKFAAGNPESGRYLLTALDRADEAWQKVERVGMNYGVMPAIAGR